MSFAVVDLETTGLDPSRDRIVEIAILLLDHEGKTEGSWSSLVNPGRPVKATFIHGISDDDVADAPPFYQLLPVVARLMAGRAIVAHNASFDTGFLNAAFARSGYPARVTSDALVCTMELSKIYLPEGRHSLVAACERAGVALDRHHRALSDASATAGLLRCYLEAETRGQRFSQRAVSRTGTITLPAAWLRAQEEAKKIFWPDFLA